MIPSIKYDYVFTGTGAAALSLAVRIKHSPSLRNKSILLIDRSPKNKNDRTWSFWEQGDGFFESIIYKSWDHLSFVSEGMDLSLDITPYRYKMIRGIDFYEHCMDTLRLFPDVQLVQGNVEFCDTPDGRSSLLLNGELFDTSGAMVFNSIFDEKLQQRNEIYLLQHFKGWIIETDAPFFDPDRAILMDFTVDQSKGTTFAYVLPFSDRMALVEYTLFTSLLLDDSEYEAGLQRYLQSYLKGMTYRIIEKEFGVIPMTDRQFRFFNNGIFHIGTAGGQTKASTGYTFQFIQKQSAQIIAALEKGTLMEKMPVGSPSRFPFYDGILLYLLAKGRPSGKEIFSKLFSRNRAAAIFRFLDNESTLLQELQLMASLPQLPFLKAALRRFF